MSQELREVVRGIGEAIEERTNGLLRGPQVEMLLYEVMQLGFQVTTPAGVELNEDFPMAGKDARVIACVVDDNSENEGRYYSVHMNGSLIELGNALRSLSTVFMKRLVEDVPVARFSELLADVAQNYPHLSGLFKTVEEGFHDMTRRQR